MSINFTDFSKAPIQDSPLKTVFEDALKGYQIGQAPKQMADEAKKRELANALQQKALEHKDKEYSLADALKEAQIKKANRPVTGAAALKPNGIIANFKYTHPNATDDEVREFADKVFKTQLEHQQSGTERSNILNDTQEQRAPRSPISKIHYELNDINKGYLPYTKEKLTPEQQDSMRSDLLLDVVKKTTDTGTRNKLINASNMNITLGAINPKNLTGYSGIQGNIDKLGDSLKEAFGESNPRYEAYRAEVLKANAAAKQMRQYLGDSIQPSQQERLDHLTNPESWNVSPKLAEENFEFMRDLMKRESNTLIRAAKDPSLYTYSGNAPKSNKVFNLATGRME